MLSLCAATPPNGELAGGSLRIAALFWALNRQIKGIIVFKKLLFL